jgi:HPt (histidine-containing phosphotransfer) domain-containing protein
VSTPLDQDTLNSLRELASPDQPEFLKQLFTLFIESSPTRIQTIQSSLKKNDLNAIAREAHTLKSSSANIGALALSKLCQDLETAARSSNTSVVSLEAAKLQAALDSVLAAIAQLPEMR